MVKESILFVVSTGLLIYFVTPSDEPTKADVAPDETQQQVATKSPPADDGWGDDESEEDYESFTFGEPLTVSDDDSDEPVDEEQSSNREEQPDSGAKQAAPDTGSRKNAAVSSPGSSEKGSIDNPIILKTNNPPDPEDD